MTRPDPYDRQIFHGKPLDNATIQALKVAESRLGYELTILQGIGGAEASGGTHTDGRAVDLSPYDWKRKVKVLRDLGFVAWRRPALKGVWSEHVHAVLIFESRSNRKGISYTGFAQIGDYDHGGVNGRPGDGLAGTRTDPNPYRPSPPRVFSLRDYEETFAVPVQRPTVNHITKARDAVVESHHAAGVAIVELEKTSKARVQSRTQIVVLRAVRRTLNGVLLVLPKK